MLLCIIFREENLVLKQNNVKMNSLSRQMLARRKEK